MSEYWILHSSHMCETMWMISSSWLMSEYWILHSSHMCGAMRMISSSWLMSEYWILHSSHMCGGPHCFCLLLQVSFQIQRSTQHSDMRQVRRCRPHIEFVTDESQKRSTLHPISFSTEWYETSASESCIQYTVLLRVAFNIYCFCLLLQVSCYIPTGLHSMSRTRYHSHCLFTH